MRGQCSGLVSKCLIHQLILSYPNVSLLILCKSNVTVNIINTGLDLGNDSLRELITFLLFLSESKRLGDFLFR